MLIDSHCHLNYDYAPKTPADLVREAGEEGVGHLVSVGVDLDTMPLLESITAAFPNVVHTVGVHPHEAEKWKRGEDEDRLRRHAKHPKCRAVGEIGLDYYYAHSDRASQLAVFRTQWEIALELGLPIVIHARDADPAPGAAPSPVPVGAEADLLRGLAEYARQVPAGRPIGAIHCFTGSRAFGEACLDLGFLISFSGILTFKTAESLRESARAFPLDRLMVETDSPYLAPIPFRGKKCEPRMVKQTALKLAEIKGISLEEVAQATSANAKFLFRI